MCRHLILALLVAGLFAVGCDFDGSNGDTTALPSEDIVSSDAALPDATAPDIAQDVSLTEDTISDVQAPEDVIYDVQPPEDTILDVQPPEDTISDLPSDISEPAYPCCLDDDDCLKDGIDDWTCAWGEMQAENPEYGRCMGPVTWEDGLCWDDGDCPDGEICMGASYCPCDMGCAMPDSPGQCQDKEELGDIGDLCGPDGGDCKPELVCCYPCGIEGCQFQCTTPCDEDEIWCSGGCPMLP